MTQQAQLLDDDEIDLEGVLRDAQAAANAARIFKSREGKVYVRIVPQAPRADGVKRKYYEPFGQHFSLQQLFKNPFAPKAARCLHLTLQQDCPACAKNLEQSKLITLADGSIDKDLKDLVWHSRGQLRFVLNILEVTPRNGALAPEVLVWEVSEKTLNAIQGIFQLYGNVASTKTGSVLEVTFEKVGFGNQVKNIQKCPGEGPIPLSDWKESRLDLQQYIEAECLTQAEMAAMINDVEPNGGSMAGPASHNLLASRQPGASQEDADGNGLQHIVSSLKGNAGPVPLSSEVGASDEDETKVESSEANTDDIYARMLEKAGPEARKRLLERLNAGS